MSATLTREVLSEIAVGPFQTTLQGPAHFEGVGMHSGLPCNIRLEAASAGNGIRFIRNGVIIPARAEYVHNTRRATCLESDGVRVDTVEHLLSALRGLEIDNADIYVDGCELPILDGSGREWVDGLKGAGIRSLDHLREVHRLRETLALTMGESSIVTIPSERLRITCVTHFDHPMLGSQVTTFDPENDLYEHSIAPARTFGFAEEVDALRAAGLAMGGSLDNALIVYQDRFSDTLRVEDECNRHKMLDLIGDLSLSGVHLAAEIVAIRPGHQINSAFARLLARAAGEQASFKY